jgi:hypothetical protein
VDIKELRQILRDCGKSFYRHGTEEYLAAEKGTLRRVRLSCGRDIDITVGKLRLRQTL